MANIQQQQLTLNFSSPRNPFDSGLSNRLKLNTKENSHTLYTKEERHKTSDRGHS